MNSIREDCRYKEVLEEVTSDMPFKSMVGLIAWNCIQEDYILEFSHYVTIHY